jgi:hypothetical protein
MVAESAKAGKDKPRVATPKPMAMIDLKFMIVIPSVSIQQIGKSDNF